MLFQINNTIQKHTSTDQNISIDINKYMSEAVFSDMASAIGTIQDGYSYHYDSVHKWSAHELLAYILKQTGPGEVYIATWAIKQYPASIIAQLKEEHHITHLTMMLDYRIANTSDDAYSIILGCADKIIHARSHAKLTVIQNKNWGVSIVGSANYTQNTRNEVGVITCSQEIAEYRKNWIKNFQNNGNS
jgi:hypothetical protein